jgi:hypothetical protein
MSDLLIGKKCLSVAAAGFLLKPAQPFAPLKLCENHFGAKAVLAEQHETVKPQVGHFIDDVFGGIVLGGHDAFGGLLADLLEHAVGGLGKELGDVAAGGVGPLRLSMTSARAARTPLTSRAGISVLTQE